MAEFIIPTLTEIGVFIIQIIFAMILWQGYELVKSKVKISKIKADREELALNMSKPKDMQDLIDSGQKPDTLSERIEYKLRKLFRRNENETET